MQKNILSLVRPNILRLEAYSSARDEFSGTQGIFLDANENPFGTFNRYPDPHQKQLKNVLSKLKNVPVSQIFLGNGSDEVIDTTLRVFCTPVCDSIIICPPTYGMYEVSAHVHDVQVLEVPLNENFQLDINTILSTEAKIVFVCSPNNPTGNALDDIEKLLQNFNGIVFVDEAYIDFCTRPSFIEKLPNYPNLIVSQTLSKAWAMAALRVGIAYASEEIIALYNKVKAPYNISRANQQIAIEYLQGRALFEENVRTILAQRVKLHDALLRIACVKKIYPSDANFLLVEVSNAPAIYAQLVREKIITRNRHTVVKNCIRISVGTPEENEELITALSKIP